MLDENKNQKTICIVEDDENIREIYSKKLEIEGFEVVTAVDGEDGINVINQNKPDLILLDLQMPVKNGLEVLQALKVDEQLSNIPVIILTNADDEKTISEAGKFETRFYVMKALTTPQKLAGIVREVLH